MTKISDAIIEIANAQSLFAATLAHSLAIKGIISIDELTKNLEKANGANGQSTNSLIESLIDGLRQSISD